MMAQVGGQWNGRGLGSAAERVEADRFAALLFGEAVPATTVSAPPRPWAPPPSEDFPTGQYVGQGRMVGPDQAAASAAVLDANLAKLQTGELVRSFINEANDHWAQHICDVGVVQRGWRLRRIRSGRRAGQMAIHPAVDIGGRRGTLVHAMRSGVVEQSGVNGRRQGFGEVILLRHTDGSTSFYAHLDRRLVGRGQLVEGGEVIGHMGRTSRAAAPPRRERDRGRRSDPRAQGFPNMPTHLHMSIHGVTVPAGIAHGPNAGSGTLPAVPPRRQAVRAYGGADLVSMATDATGGRINEHDWGVDPVAYLGHFGVALFAAPFSR